MKDKTTLEEVAVLKDCFVRAIALPAIYSDEAVRSVIHWIENDRISDDDAEEVIIDAYKVFLEKVIREYGIM